ncbi:cell envelope integrity protein TolA [Marinomonas transparens]|uniref:Cell envelope integrity protein TolA n=1 Tax=Marinomonas transparens TaxID=2795388 RepID=A0A934JTT8_9GAMM|nr:cell envelope integrity protein TolA [Marinomonas transparens]MBJ7538191.1 cell envelope integrity protein TolA [Marinomonas transparens]
MKGFRKDGYGLPVLLAIGLHAAIIVAGLISVDFSSKDAPIPKRPPIVNASIVDVSQTIIGKREAEKKAAQKRKAALTEKKKKAEEQKRKKNAQRKALEEKKKKLAQAKAKEKAEKEKKLKQQAREKKQREEKAKALKLKEEKEKKRLAEIKSKELAKKKAQELEEQRKKEAAKVEAARIAEEERKRQEETAREAEKQRLAEEAASKAAAEELAKQQAFEEAQMVQSISGLINNRVTAAWIRPPNARNGMITHLRIYFLPNGEVRDVEVTKSSGDGLFDQRAADAVKKVRQIEELADVDSYIFERNFRQVDLIFNPQDLRN